MDRMLAIQRRRERLERMAPQRPTDDLDIGVCHGMSRDTESGAAEQLPRRALIQEAEPSSAMR